MFKPIIASALAVIASAAPTLASTFENHKALWSTLQSAGVNTYINPDDCWESKNAGVYGWYEGNIKHLVICQDNKDEAFVEVVWTENDLDTLRHEAQHFIQDCMVGNNHDHDLGQVYDNPIRLAHKILGSAGVSQVVEAYSDRGDHVIVLELEAFAVATMNDPLEQVNDIKKFCF